MKELEAAQLHKQALERQILTLQSEKEAEVTELRQQLMDTQQSLQAALERQAQWHDADALNQQLALELEKERGRIAGTVEPVLFDHLRNPAEVVLREGCCRIRGSFTWRCERDGFR